MKALISPIDDNLVSQVEPDDQTFEVATPYYWEDCPDNIIAGKFKFKNGKYVAFAYEQTSDQNKNHAKEDLINTDWTSFPDVGNPDVSDPYLVNQSAFLAYRSKIREIAINPVAGNLDVWSELPTPIWQNK